MEAHPGWAASDYSLITAPPDIGMISFEAGSKPNQTPRSKEEDGVEGRCSSSKFCDTRQQDDVVSVFPEFTAYILSPADVVVGRTWDWEDRVGWLLEKGLELL